MQRDKVINTEIKALIPKLHFDLMFQMVELYF